MTFNRYILFRMVVEFVEAIAKKTADGLYPEDLWA